MNKKTYIIAGSVIALVIVLYFTGVLGKKKNKMTASPQQIREAWENAIQEWTRNINGWAEREELGWDARWFDLNETEKYNAAAWQIFETGGWKNKLPDCWTVKFFGDGSKAELVQLNQFECGLRSLGL